MDVEYSAVSATPRTQAEGAHEAVLGGDAGTSGAAVSPSTNTPGRTPGRMRSNSPSFSPLGSPGRPFSLDKPWTAGLEQERQKRVAAGARARERMACQKSSLKVVLRARPMLPGEDEKPGGERVVKCESRLGDWLSLKRNGHEETHRFSTSVLGPDARQRDVFVECGRPLLDAVLSGQSACLMAYGQTGAGKTFSMFGDEGGRNPSKLDGVIPQVASDALHAAAAVPCAAVCCAVLCCAMLGWARVCYVVRAGGLRDLSPLRAARQARRERVPGLGDLRGGVQHSTA